MSERKEVKRYTRIGLDGAGLIAELKMVDASAYDALLSEKAALRDANFDLQTRYDAQDAAHDALAAENERLREELTQRIGKAVPMTEWEKLVADRDRLRDEVRHLRSAIAGAREAIELALRCIDWHTPVDYCPERVRHNNAKDQLRALSSIGDLPAGEEG